MGNAIRLVSLSEKQYTKPSPAWQEIVDFFASALPLRSGPFGSASE
jgi:hypothetical protein